MTMWLAVMVFVGVCATVYTTPVSNTEVEKVRSPREIIECCPCEGAASRSWRDAEGELDSTTGVRAALDDCPCRSRTADSEGAPSVLVPNKIHALKTSSDEEAKEESKHILQPEVDFASSFLNTLKEATDEEYKEALARDAARSAAKEEDVGIDTEPRETEKTSVTILVNANQDPLTDEDLFIPEASHVQEARCVHPLAKTKLRNPKSKDNYLEASNIHEQIAPKAESKSPLSKALKNNLKLKKLSGTLQHHVEMTQTQQTRNDDTDDDSRNLDPVNESNEERDRSILGEIVTRPIKDLLKLRDIELLPKATLTEELSPIAEHFKNKLNQLKTVANIKQLNLKSVLEPKSDSSVLASNIKEHISELKPLFPLGNLLKSKSFDDENSIHDKSKSIKSTVPKLKLFPPTNINQGISPLKSLKEIKLPNLMDNLGTKNLKAFRSTAIDTNDNGASASSVVQQIASMENQQTHEVTSNKKSAATDKPNLFPMLNLSNLNEVLKPLKSLSLPNLFQDAVKPVEAKGHSSKEQTAQLNLPSDKEETEILDTIPSQSEISIASESGENSDSQTICEASSENTIADQSTHSNTQNALVVDKNDSPEKFLSLDGIGNSEDTDFESQRSSEDNDCILEEDTTDQGAIIPQMLSHDEEDLSCEQSIDHSSVTQKMLAPSKDDLFTDQNIDQNIIIPQTLRPDNSLSSTSSKLVDQETTTSGDIDTTSSVDDTQNLDRKNLKSVSYEELQRMSDSLLDKNNDKNNEQNVNTHDPDIKTHGFSSSGENENQGSSFLDQTTQFKTGFEVTTQKIISEGCLPSKIKLDNDNKKERNINEMAFGASKNIEIAHPFLDSNPVKIYKNVQPKHNLILPSLIERSVDEISNIKPKIPIKDLHSQIKSLINGGVPKEHSVSEISPTVGDLISAMSKPKKSKMLPAKNLEDINIDIFNLKTLGLSHALEKPLNLRIKPLEMFSAEGDKKGLLEGSLDFSPDKLKETIVQPKSQNILGSSLNLPDLTDLRAKMKNNLANLLPVDSTPSNILQDTAGSNPIEILSDRFRSHTEDAVQSIQHTLGSVFKETSPNILGSSFTHPKDFIAEINQRHEDLKDKLEGIRYDLNDRLTSFHEDILENSKFVIPTFPNEHIMSFKPKIAQPTIKSSIQNRQAQKRKPVKTKMVSSASNFIPKIVNMTRIRTPSSLQPLNSNTMERTTVQHIESGMPATTKQLKPLMPAQNTLKNPKNLRYFNLGQTEKSEQTQIKMSFPNTTSRQSLLENKTKKPKTNAYNGSKQKPIEKFLKSQHFDTELKMNRNSKPSPIKMKNAENPTLFAPAGYITKTNRDPITSKEQFTLNDRSLLSNPIITKTKISKAGLKKPFNIPKTSLPKVSNSSDFLSKIREAWKTRLLKSEKGKVSITKSSLPVEEMSRAASETSKVLQPVTGKEPVKENTPYKCRLLCTKDSSEV